MPILLLLFSALALSAAGSPPAGLVLSEGAEVVRDGKPPVPALAGELLYPGDIVTARKPVRVLSCIDKLMSTLPAGVSAMVEARGLTAGRWDARKPIKACFLPAVNKGPVGGPKHLGAMMIRGMDSPAAGAREARIQSLEEDQRDTLLRSLAALEGEEPESYVMRGVLFQRARLHLDAKQEFAAASKLWPGAAWLKVLMIAADDAALRAR